MGESPPNWAFPYGGVPEWFRASLPEGYAADLDVSDLVAGSYLVREYAGTLHRVWIVPPVLPTERRARRRAQANGWYRYIYRGERYKSLSAVAFKITRDRTMSGNRFFGLRRRRRRVPMPQAHEFDSLFPLEDSDG